ncbi:MAG: CehA/McbA family metallohydrolase [Halioglobus sp.]
MGVRLFLAHSVPVWVLSLALAQCLFLSPAVLAENSAQENAISPSAFYAAQLTEQNIGRLPAIGMDGIGGIDDWFLTNGTLCAVISSKKHASYLSLHGGVLVDLWHCDSANDQWNSSHPQFNLQKNEIPITQSISAGSNAQQAFVETRATREGLEARIRYSFSALSPAELDIETRITRVGEGESIGMFGSLVLHPRGSLTPYTLDTEAREYSRGANQPAVHSSDQLSVIGSVAVADLQILLGSRHIQPSITYGVKNDGALLRYEDGTQEPLHQFLLGGQDFSLFGAFTVSFPSWWSRTPGPVSFISGLLADLNPGETFLLRQSVLVAKGSTAAGITDRVYGGALIKGKLDTAEAGIAVTDGEGKAVTFLRPAADGRFEFAAPMGLQALKLTIETPWSTTVHSAKVTEPAFDLGELNTGAVAVLRLPQGETMNLVFEGVAAGGTDSEADTEADAETDGQSFNPIFQRELLSRQLGGEQSLTGPESHRISLAGVPDDLREVQLPPGAYRITASRGPEYSATVTNVKLAAGEATTLEVALPKRVLQTANLVSADFHLHSGLSFDSSLSPTQRVIDFVAQGGEIMVPTEHFVTYSLGNTIEALGLEEEIISFPGVEISGMASSEVAPTTIGHSNVFPVEADASAFLGGTLPFENLRLGQVIGAYKAKFPRSIYQLNHPRDTGMDDDIAFLNHLSQGVAYDPELPLTEAPNALLLEKHAGSAYRDIDFDVMELLNGHDMALYTLNRTDWFSFLKQNIYHVATANSDSHMSAQLVAYPRNMLSIEHTSLAEVSTADIVDAVMAGRVYGTTGPMLTVSLEDKGPGETFTGAEAMLNVVVESASWIPVTEARVWVNGELSETFPIVVGEPLAVALALDTDSFVFVEVAGAPSPIYSAVAPGYAPFAFANPIFVDVAGDGWRFGEG